MELADNLKKTSIYFSLDITHYFIMRDDKVCRIQGKIYHKTIESLIEYYSLMYGQYWEQPIVLHSKELIAEFTNAEFRKKFVEYLI